MADGVHSWMESSILRLFRVFLALETTVMMSLESGLFALVCDLETGQFLTSVHQLSAALGVPLDVL